MQSITNHLDNTVCKGCAEFSSGLVVAILLWNMDLKIMTHNAKVISGRTKGLQTLVLHPHLQPNRCHLQYKGKITMCSNVLRHDTFLANHLSVLAARKHQAILAITTMQSISMASDKERERHLKIADYIKCFRTVRLANCI